MKKIFTLLFAAGMVTFASAQSNAFNHGKPNDGYAFNKRQPVVYNTNRGYDVVAERYDSHVNNWQRNGQFQQQEERTRYQEFGRGQVHYQKDNHGFGKHAYTCNKKHSW